MAIKVTINSKTVRNPIARFLITLLGLVIVITVFVLVFFLVFPIIWFWTVSLLLLVLTVLAAIPKLKGQYRIIVEDKSKVDTTDSV
jgi:uncharacterized Tic20 family protein